MVTNLPNEERNYSVPIIALIDLFTAIIDLIKAIEMYI
jgi:hypothetical protein